MAKETSTVHVRIAVIVDEYGAWSAAGHSGLSDEAARSVAMANGTTNGMESLRFVEADVPLPAAPLTVCV